MWEVALTLTKPKDINRVKLTPVIKNMTEYCREEKIYGAIDIILEKEDSYAQFSIIDIYKEFHTIEEEKEAQKEILNCLTDYMEQFLKDDNITLIWNQIEELDIDWYKKPQV